MATLGGEEETEEYVTREISPHTTSCCVGCKAMSARFCSSVAFWGWAWTREEDILRSKFAALFAVNGLEATRAVEQYIVKNCDAIVWYGDDTHAKNECKLGLATSGKPNSSNN